MRIILATLIIILFLVSGCIPITNNKGFHILGYTNTTEKSRLDIGFVSSNILVDNALREEPDVFWEEDIKDSGIIFGLHYQKEF